MAAPDSDSIPMCKYPLRKAFVRCDMRLSDDEAIIMSGKGRLETVKADCTECTARRDVPQAMDGYALPMYLRAAACRLDPADTENAILDRLVKQIYILPPEETYFDVFMQMFLYPFLMVIPENVSIIQGAEKATPLVESITSIIHEKNANAVWNTAHKNSHANAIIEISCVLLHVSQRCSAMHSPEEIAAIIVVAFVMFPCFYSHEWNIKAGVFLANAILLREGKPPISEEYIDSELLFVAAIADAQAWKTSTKRYPVYDRVYELIKKLPVKCFVCGKIDPLPCPSCNYIWYCKGECQTAVRKEHKTVCELTKTARKTWDDFRTSRSL